MVSAKDQAGSDPNRRDFLYIATGAAGTVGAAALAWPFIDQMNPDATTRALATIEVDISSIEPGQAITIKWRGAPMFIRNRTPEEIAAAKAVSLSDLKDPLARNSNVEDGAATDENRSAGEGHENWLIMSGTCTHLGCSPEGQLAGDRRGDYGGWYCPCHGSHYDTAGRIRFGPATENLPVPPIEFISDTVIKIG